MTVHPVLFALLPILWLYHHNIGQLSLSELGVPLAAAAAAALVLWRVLWRVLGDRGRPALIASLFWVWFFSYGHLWDGISKAPAANWLFAQRYVFTTVYGLFLAGGVAVLVWGGRNWQKAASVVNLVAVVLVAWQVVTVGEYELRRALAAEKRPRSEQVKTTQEGRASAFPNIYYVILDGYGRADVLKEVYGYDNSDFVNYLREKGFFVAREGRSNYCQTLLSLASSLNMDYLEELAEEMGPESDDRRPLEDMIAHSRVGDFLVERGYRTAAFATGYEGTELRTFDRYLRQEEGLSLFQSALLKTTPLTPSFAARRLFGFDEADIHRRRVLYALNHLADAARSDEAVFVFAHVLSPHPPFVFDRNGRRVRGGAPYGIGDGTDYQGPKERYVRDYREQLIFLNGRIRAAVDRLLATARRPTVVVLQADHGPGSGLNWQSAEKTDLHERFGILNAYYLPGGDGDAPLREDMSPVNTFRVVLSRYFGASLRRLPDESYYSPFGHPYRLTKVTDAAKAGAAVEKVPAAGQ